MRLHPKDWLALGFAVPVNDISLTMRSTRMRILQIRSIGTDRSRMIGSMGVGAFTVCAMASSPERISAAIAIPCTLHSSSEETTYGSRIRASASFVSSPVRPANGSRNASPSAPRDDGLCNRCGPFSRLPRPRQQRITLLPDQPLEALGRSVSEKRQPLGDFSAILGGYSTILGIRANLRPSVSYDQSPKLERHVLHHRQRNRDDDVVGRPSNVHALQSFEKTGGGRIRAHEANAVLV